eukprot:365502-Chlamydomonas_euryale.AAC.1
MSHTSCIHTRAAFTHELHSHTSCIHTPAAFTHQLHSHTSCAHTRAAFTHQLHSHTSCAHVAHTHACMDWQARWGGEAQACMPLYAHLPHVVRAAAGRNWMLPYACLSLVVRAAAGGVCMPPHTSHACLPTCLPVGVPPAWGDIPHPMNVKCGVASRTS